MSVMAFGLLLGLFVVVMALVNQPWSSVSHGGQNGVVSKP